MTHTSNILKVLSFQTFDSSRFLGDNLQLLYLLYLCPILIGPIPKETAGKDKIASKPWKKGQIWLRRTPFCQSLQTLKFVFVSTSLLIPVGLAGFKGLFSLQPNRQKTQQTLEANAYEPAKPMLTILSFLCCKAYRRQYLQGLEFTTNKALRRQPVSLPQPSILEHIPFALCQ